MAFTLTQVPVGTSAAPLVTIPLGATVTLLASALTTIGTSNSVTAGTGFALPANVPVTWMLNDDDVGGPATLYGITAASSTVSVALSN